MSAHSWVLPRLVLADPFANEDGTTVVLHDLDGDAHGAYGVQGKPALVLVRPDGHIAFRAPADGAARLAAYCARVCGTEPAPA